MDELDDWFSPCEEDVLLIVSQIAFITLTKETLRK